MAKLINCFECGSSVSDEARVCPKCHTSSVKGVTCHVCCRQGKGSVMTRKDHPGGDNYDGWTSWFHSECFDAVERENQSTYINCIACHISVHAFKFSCPQCGHPLGDKSFCQACSEPVSKSGGVANIGGRYGKPGYVHQVCYQYRSNDFTKGHKSDKSKSNSCFVATVVYDSPFAAEVIALRYFREILYFARGWVNCWLTSTIWQGPI